jgi:hypothetical protein
MSQTTAAIYNQTLVLLSLKTAAAKRRAKRRLWQPYLCLIRKETGN